MDLETTKPALRQGHAMVGVAPQIFLDAVQLVEERTPDVFLKMYDVIGDRLGPAVVADVDDCLRHNGCRVMTEAEQAGERRPRDTVELRDALVQREILFRVIRSGVAPARHGHGYMCRNLFQVDALGRGVPQGQRVNAGLWTGASRGAGSHRS